MMAKFPPQRYSPTPMKSLRERNGPNDYDLINGSALLVVKQANLTKKERGRSPGRRASLLRETIANHGLNHAQAIM